MEQATLISKFNAIKLASKLKKLKEKTGFIIQSLLFSKSKFDIKSAKKWAKSEGYLSSKVLITDNKIRLRQKQPGRFKTFRTINIAKGIKALIASSDVSQFVGTMKLLNFSKFSQIKSDLEMKIPMKAEIEFLCEGKNRDGIINRVDLEESLDSWEGIPIIDFHDMKDLNGPTEHKIRDRAGYLGKPTLKIKSGQMWIRAPVEIIDRALAYHLYVKSQSNKPLEVSPEFASSIVYDGGQKYQTNIRPHLICIVDKGHIKNNKISITS